MMKDRH